MIPDRMFEPIARILKVLASIDKKDRHDVIAYAIKVLCERPGMVDLISMSNPHDSQK